MYRISLSFRSLFAPFCRLPDKQQLSLYAHNEMPMFLLWHCLYNQILLNQKYCPIQETPSALFRRTGFPIRLLQIREVVVFHWLEQTVVQLACGHFYSYSVTNALSIVIPFYLFPKSGTHLSG